MGKRSIKLDGKTTSLFLEDAFWRELETRAAERDSNWTDYLRELLNELEPSSNRSAAIKESLVHKLRDDLNTVTQVTKKPSQKSETKHSIWLCETEGISKRLILEKDRILVGRDEYCDIVFDDEVIDKRHCIIVNDGDKWWLMDCDSSSGTFLNSSRITACLIPRHGEIRVGNSYIKRV